MERRNRQAHRYTDGFEILPRRWLSNAPLRCSIAIVA
jgi:hypothetical protein